MKLIVGLGNPGPRYTETRHNIGRRVLEAYAQSLKASWKFERKLRAECAFIEESATQVMLARLGTFMNESGAPVKSLVEHFEVDFEKDLLLVVDDAALPFGKLRLRPKGSDGGHRGLRSVESFLASREYARLRIGIAPSEPVAEPLEEYVLKAFTAGERKRLNPILIRAREACRLWTVGPIEKVMDQVNQPGSRASA